MEKEVKEVKVAMAPVKQQQQQQGLDTSETGENASAGKPFAPPCLVVDLQSTERALDQQNPTSACACERRFHVIEFNPKDLEYSTARTKMESTLPPIPEVDGEEEEEEMLSPCCPCQCQRRRMAREQAARETHFLKSVTTDQGP